MNILLLGASGFIGSRIAAQLTARGHTLTTPTRCELNLMQLDENAARALMDGQDILINAIGIMSRHAQALETIHHHAPVQLARWAAQQGIKRFVQLSALGADPAHPVNFVGSKGRGDAALLDSGLPVNIARPSLVFGRGGASSELFIKLARLPVIALPAAGAFILQPVHVDEVAEGLALLAEQDAHGQILNMTGAAPCTLAELIQTLRIRLHGKPPARILPIPLILLKPLLPLTNILSDGMLSAGNIRLLQEGNQADNRDFATLLGRPPQSAGQFLSRI